MPQYKEAMALNEISKAFFEKCFVKDDSFLWNAKNLWTKTNLDQLWERINGNPILGSDQSFFEKLNVQMVDADSELYKLLAEILFLYSLIPKQIKSSTKLRWIETIIEAGNLPKPSFGFEEYLEIGTINSGQKYNRKHEQISLIIKAAQIYKDSKRSTKHEDFRVILDQANMAVQEIAISAADMRHALLYMFFPEYYEDSVNTRHKQKIVETYSSLLEKVPADTDDAIFEIRQVLAPTHDIDGEPFSFYRDLEDEWKTSKRQPTSQSKDPEIHETTAEYLGELANLKAVLKYTRNLILHGPPGTGKTYTAKRLANSLTLEQLQKEKTKEMVLQEIVEGLTVYEAIAFSLYHPSSFPRFSVQEIQQSDYLKARFRLRPVQHQKETIWGSMQAHTDPKFPNVKVAKYNEPFLFQKHDDSKWSLTEEGKKYLEDNYANELGKIFNDNESEKTIKSNPYIFWTTFHQNYSYEDFIEGIRPKTSDDDPSLLTYEIKYGTFRQVCAIASADPENKYFLIIDEINRGNIAKIFGELISLIEDDKRQNEKNELRVTMPYSSEEFSVPNNLFILGTMNTADRSIALIDVALRRRFAFIEVMPNPDLLSGEVIKAEGAELNLKLLFEMINQQISIDLDRNHQLGHSYFLPIVNADDIDKADVLEFVWNNQILPLLEEYYFNQYDKLRNLIKPFLDESDSNELFSTISIGKQYGDDLVFALQAMLDSKLGEA